VWISVFVLDLTQFVDDHLRLLRGWQVSFAAALIAARNEKVKKVEDVEKEVRECFSTKEGMTKLDFVDARISETTKLVQQIGKIEAITGRIQIRLEEGLILNKLKTDLANLKADRDAAVDRFERRRAENLKDLEADAVALNSELAIARETFRRHGPFSLSWKSGEATAELRSTGERLAAFRARESALIAAAVELGDESLFTKPAGLNEAEIEVKDVTEVWEVQGRWEELQVRTLSECMIKCTFFSSINCNTHWRTAPSPSPSTIKSPTSKAQ